MKKILMSGTAALAMFAFLNVGAKAADLEMADQVYDWNGPYVGLNIGVGGVDIEGVYDNASSPLPLGGLADVGVLGGGQVGWNIQSDSLVFGIEADISLVDWNDSTVSPSDGRKGSFDPDFLATVRGRIGIAQDNILLFATGGIAFLEGEWSEDEDDESKNISATGGIIGAGIEWGATENMTVKVEGLYAFFNDNTSLANIPSDGDDGDYFEVKDAVIARIGVNWAF